MTDIERYGSDEGEHRKRYLCLRWKTHIQSISIRIRSLYVAFAAAVFLTLTYYPGAFYYDVIRQFNWVKLICNSLRHGEAKLPDDFISWWPIWNTLFRVPIYILTDEPGFILFITIVVFFWSARELCRSFSAEAVWPAFILLCTFTPAAAWIVLHGPHTISAAFLFFAISRYLTGRYLFASLFSVGGVLFRPDAVLIALALPAALALVGRLKMWRALSAGLIAALGFSFATWKYPDPSTAEHTSAEGLAILTLAILAQKPSAFVDDPTLSSFFRHVPPFDLQCSITGVYCQANIESTYYNAVHRPGSLGRLIQSNLRLLAKDVRLYLGTVLQRIALASKQRLAVVELGRTDWLHIASLEEIKNYMTINMTDLVRRHQIFYMSSFGAFYIPLVFICIMIMGGFMLRRVDIIAITLACALIYLPKTIILPDQEIRYYFFELMFSLLLALIALSTMVGSFVGALCRNIAAGAQQRKTADLSVFKRGALIKSPG
jgi:hypothetical protein